MQDRLSEILDNILGLLLLEGTYDIQEDENGLNVLIDTPQAGRLIGFKGETLSSLQLLINQTMTKYQDKEFKRVILDVAGWRKQKEEELLKQAKTWAQEVKESGQELELEPMPSWQRRLVHMGVSEVEGVKSESVGEGRDRHLIIKTTGEKA